MQPHEIQPPDDDHRHLTPQRGDATDRVFPIMLGVAAIVTVTLLFLSGDQNDPFPVTAPRTEQPPTK